MKKYVLLISIVTLNASFLYSQENWQIDSVGAGMCYRQADAIKVKMAERTKQYENDVEDYKKGRFCSDCKRSAGKIEREDRISYEEHIKAGEAGGRKSITATKEMYDKLVSEYLK